MYKFMARPPIDEVISNEVDVFCTDAIDPDLMEYWINLVQQESGCLAWWSAGMRVNMSTQVSTPCYVVSTYDSGEKVAKAINTLSPVLTNLIMHCRLEKMFNPTKVESC